MVATGPGGGATVTYGAGSVTANGGGAVGHVQLSGTVSTTFTWVPRSIGGIPDPLELPPTQVIVLESSNVQSTATAYGPGVSPSVSAVNGLGNAATLANNPIVGMNGSQIGLTQISSSAGALPYLVAGKSSITINDCVVAGQATSPNGPFGQTFTYSVSITPITLSLIGVTTDTSNWNQYGEVGRQVIGSLYVPGNVATLSNYSWTIGGPTFKSYEHDSAGVTTLLSSQDTSSPSPSWHWLQPATANVSASATVTVLGHNLGTVTLSEPIVVEAPGNVEYSFTTSGNTAQVYFGVDSAGNPACQVGGDAVGVYYDFGASKCPHWPSGTLFTGQLVNANWQAFSVSGLQTLLGSVNTNGQYWLDTSYPYSLTRLTFDPAVFQPGTPPTFSTDSDSPKFGVTLPGAVTVNTTFLCYLMYQSADPSEQDVSLKSQSWLWNAAYPGGGSSPTLGASSLTVFQPQWGEVLRLR